MKKLYLVTLLVAFTSAHAQKVVDDFENTANNWVPVDCGAGIVDNPYQAGLNISCKCLQMERVRTA